MRAAEAASVTVKKDLMLDRIRLGGSMKPSTKDQIEGNLHEVKGKAKEITGQVTKNPTLRAKGKSEHLAGKIQKKVGQLEKVLEK